MYKEYLERRGKDGLLRHIRDRASAMGRTITIDGTIDGRELLNFASNDYLGLGADERLKQAAAKALMVYGTGAGASRLLSGGTTLHKELESRLAGFKGTAAALVFNSGYAANTGALPALAGEGDAIFSDELNHASLIDGCRLSQATSHIYRHSDTVHLEELLGASREKLKIVVTDTVFSMGGDIVPLPRIMELCDKYGAMLYLDDAHATGIFGNGHGMLAHFGLKPEPWVIQMGTFSKAMGSFGAFIAGDKDMTDWLVNAARSFAYSTALPPAAIAASRAALDIIETDTSLNERLWANRERLVKGLKIIGLDTGKSETPIIPILIDSVNEAIGLSEGLLKEGIYAPAIRPPTVKEPRLRLTVTASHTEKDIDRLLRALGD